MAKSPSITIREVDKSSYAVTDSSTVLALIGYGTKGPIGRAKMITSKNEFIQTYGTIPESSPYGHLAAYRAFNQTNKVIYYRVADENSAAATITVDDSTEATAGYQEFSQVNDPIYTHTTDTDYVFDVEIDGGEAVTITVTSPLTSTWYLEDIVSAIDGELTGAVCSLENGKIRVTSDTTGASSTILITEQLSGGESLHALLGGVDTAVDGADAVAATTQVVFTALEEGSATDNISVTVSSATSPVDNSVTNYTIEVLYNGDTAETFSNLSVDPDSDDFFMDVINKDPSNGGSEWVNAEDGSTTPEGDYVLNDGTYSLSGGNDGIPSSGGASLFLTALGTDKDLANSEVFDYHILATPDNYTAIVQNAAITLAESASKQDFIYIADPPFGLEYDEATAWHNGGGNGRNTALNSSYVATYWSWLKDYNSQTDEYVWVPPSVYLAELFLRVDNNFASWFAPAGDTRGRLITSDIEHSPSFSEREVMYGDLNALNPIVEFASKGIVVYGQKTTLRTNSAVNKVSVRRTLIYIKKLIKRAMEGMVFEPHTPESWNRASTMVTNILESVRANGGLEDYQVIIDGTTNTESVVAQGIMKGIITIVPVGTIERIELNLNFLNPGASITEG